MVKLFYARNEAELALIKGLLDAEDINYFVRNDTFGSMLTGPLIDLYNKKTIVVQDEHYERSKELIMDYFSAVEESPETEGKTHSFLDKIRMIVEVVLFGWIMPGRKGGGAK